MFDRKEYAQQYREDHLLRVFPIIVMASLVLMIVLTPEIGARLMFFGVFLSVLGLYLAVATKNSYFMALPGAGFVSMLFGTALMLGLIGP